MAAFPMAARLAGAVPEPLDEFTSDLVAARVAIGRLARWAQRWLLAQDTAAPGGCCCGTARCLLAELPGGEDACRMARELAWLPVAEAGHANGRPTEARDVAPLYVQAFRDVSRAALYCQRVQHLMGECWFGTPETPGESLCARTSALSHLLGTSRRSLI